MGNIKLSVLVTFCNQKDFIKETLDSIFAQKVNFKYEVLICLDRECKESLDIITDYINKYPNVKLFKVGNSNWETINLLKASKNRLKLLMEAKGEYFCFLDGDDFYINNNRFQKLIDLLDEDYEQRYIGVFHDYCIYDHKNKTIKQVVKYSNNNCEITPKQYLKNQIHIQYSNYIFRNIFYRNMPKDLNPDAIEDTSFIYYMLRYGNIFHIEGAMFAYRINVNSCFNALSEELQNMYALLFSEINQSILPAYQEYICKWNKNLLRSCFKYFTKNDLKNNKEFALIKKVAKEQNCYFTYNLLNYTNLSLFQKIKLKINYLKYFYLYKYPKNFNYIKIFYWDANNFGDRLNSYIFQRLFNSHAILAKPNQYELVGIGSILELLFDNLKNIKFIAKIKYLFYNSIIIFSSGFSFIENPIKLNLIMKCFRFKFLALRGKLSYQKLKKYYKNDLKNCVLGDAGLCVSELIDCSNITKQYKIGVILHYVDKNEVCKNNIKIQNCKFIDVQQNPIKVLKDISECEFILSSAMHGLIAADSLNIPNKWIKLSDNIIGNDYKFRDYYSIYDINNPIPVDLRTEQITESDIVNYINDYNLPEMQLKVSKVRNKLLNLKI